MGERELINLEAAVGVLVDRALHPAAYARDVGPWERFIAAPTWAKAQPLLGRDAALVSRIVETLGEQARALRDPDVLLCLGKVRQHLGNHKGAMEVFVRLSRIHATGCVHCEIGMCYLALGDEASAREQFVLAGSVRPTDSRAEAALASLNARLAGRPDPRGQPVPVPEPSRP